MPNQNDTHHQNTLFPDESSRNSAVNERGDGDQEQVSGPGHAQPSLNVHARGSSVQPPLIKNEDTRIRHEEYDIAGPSKAIQPIQRSDKDFNREVTPLLDFSLDDGPLGSPILDPTPTATNPEAVVTAKGKEKERRYSNEGDYNNITDSASTSVARSSDIAPTFPDPNPASGVTAKGKEKERRYSEPCLPSLPPSQNPTPTPSTQTSTQSSPPNHDQSSNPTPEIVHSESTARQSLTSFSYSSEHYREPVAPHSFTTFNRSPSQSAFNPHKPVRTVSSPAPEWTQSADTNHGMTPAQIIREHVKYENDAFKSALVADFTAIVWAEDQ